MREFIEVLNVSKAFSKKNTKINAVNKVNFKIKRGETLGLVGESGSGKTTLGRALIGLETIDSGEIYIDNSNFLTLSKNEKRNVLNKLQIIFQDPYSSLNPRMSAVDIVREPLKNLSKEDSILKAKEMLEEVGIRGEDIYKLPREFSGGQRQRINIARAIINNPEFILCDEPTSALDVSIQAQILNLLISLQKKFHLTFLFISHDLSVIRYISDRIAVMYKGYIVEIGKSEDIFSNPQHEYTKRLLKTLPELDPKKSSLIYDINYDNYDEILINDNSYYKEIENEHFVRV